MEEYEDDGFNDDGEEKSGADLYSIAVLGAGAVGKSAIVLQYVQGIFITDYDPTIEDAYRKNLVLDKIPCYLDILDTAGQEDYTALRGTWMRDKHGFVLVYSILSQKSYEELDAFYQHLSVMNEESMPPIVIVGNKCDLKNSRVISLEKAQARADKWKCSYLETSAKTGVNINKVFETLIRAIRTYKPETKTSQDKGKKPPCTLL